MRWLLVVLGLVTVTCMKEQASIPGTSTASARDPQVSDASSHPGASTSDPPPPPGFVSAKIYGDESPRRGPVDRSSSWTVAVEGGTIKHEVSCDTMRVGTLQEVLRVLFSGHAPVDSKYVPALEKRERLRIEWRESGKTIAISRLLDDGTLVREHEGNIVVDRRHSAATLREVEEAIERAGLGVPSRGLCDDEKPKSGG